MRVDSETICRMFVVSDEQLNRCRLAAAQDDNGGVWDILTCEAREVTPPQPQLAQAIHQLADFVGECYRIRFLREAFGHCSVLLRFGDAQKLQSMLRKRRVSADDIRRIPDAYHPPDPMANAAMQTALSILVNGDLIIGQSEHSLLVCYVPSA